MNNIYGMEDEGFTPGKKPAESLQRLIDICRPHGTLVDTHDASTPISLTKEDGSKIVIILLDGLMNIFRNLDQLLYAVVAGPTFIGVLATNYRKEVHTFCALKGSVVMTLPRDTVIELITHHGLVRELLDYYSYITDYQTYHSYLMISRTTYETVCGLLKELMLFPDESREKISVAYYIMDRTHLARSGVMRILADLRLGGYIEIEKGKLKNIVKRFPDKY